MTRLAITRWLARAAVVAASANVFAQDGGTSVAPSDTEPPAPTAHSDGDGEEEDTPAPPPKSVPKPPPVARVHVEVQNGMVRIPGGRFTMGTRDRSAPANERPPHQQDVAPFWMDQHEITVQAYRACVDRHACSRPQRSSATCTYDLEDPELPITCVKWHEADAYCRAVGKRLPREAEWEFAARGAAATRYPWGASSSCRFAATLLHEATGRSCTGKRPAKVGSYPRGASAYGVLDLAGNAEEWTLDWYTESPVGGAPRSGAAHVLRGGGWLSPPSQCRTTSRNWGSAMEAGPNVGFRCVRDH